MEIRNAQRTDLPRIVEIYNQSVVTSTATFDLAKVTVEERTPWFLNHEGQYPLLVAVESGSVVGYCSLSRFREKKAYEHTVESSVYIDEAFHGRKYGRLLMEEILRVAKKLHHHAVIAGITKGNAGSIRLHESLGFEYVGCFKEVGFKFDEWQDVLFYQKLF